MNYIDYFAYPHFSSDKDSLYKARLLVGLMLFSIAFLAFMSIAQQFLSKISILWHFGTFILYWLLIAFFVYILMDIRSRGEFYRSTQIFLSSAFVAIYFGIIISGGPVETPSGSFLLLPVLLAFCLLGFENGVIWAGIVFGINCLGLILGLFGFHYPNVVAPDLLQFSRAMNWVFGFIVVVGIVIIYEIMNIKLKRERDVEKDKYKDMATVALDGSIVTKTATELASAGQELLDSTIQQKTAIEQLATTTEELGATAEQNAHLTASAKASIKDTEDHLLISKADILQLVSSMNEVRSSSEEIQSINNVINEISYQTNILSLNAMIEASRSSEASSGFKVVALEVKRLAERSAKAADTINKLLNTNFSSVQQGVNLSLTMRQRFDEISDRIRPLADSIQNVSDASYEQNEAISQIVLGLAEIDMAVEKNKNLAEKTSSIALELKNNSEAMTSRLALIQKQKQLAGVEGEAEFLAEDQ